MKTVFALGVLLFTLILQSCTPEWDIPPEENTYFKVKKNGVELDDSTLLKTVLYYYNSKGVAITDPDDVSEGGGDSDDTAFMHAAYPRSGDPQFKDLNIAYFYFVGGDATSGISPHTYYLKYPDGDIDTLYIVREIISNKQGKKDRCYCTAPVRILKFNGKDAVEDTSIHLLNGQPVFLFEK